MYERDPKKHGFKPRTEVTTELVQPTKKLQRYFELARNMAHNSPYGKIRHGALLAKGGSILNASFNKENFSSFGASGLEGLLGEALLGEAHLDDFTEGSHLRVSVGLTEECSCQMEEYSIR